MQAPHDIEKRVSQIQWQLIIKRLIDFSGAAIGLFVLSPVILLTALAIKITSPGPVLFRQERLGYMGKKFSFVKITFAKGATKYKLVNKPLFLGKSYTGHEDARVIMKDESGAEQELKLFGGIIEYQGRYKIMSFNVES